MWSWLGELIKPITGIATQALKNRAEKKMAEHTLKVNIIQNKARLAQDELTHNNVKEMRQLEVASPWVRWVIVAHVLALLDVGIFFPEKAMQVYANLDAMPEWVVGLFLTIFGFYFAVTKISENASSMIAAWKGKK